MKFKKKLIILSILFLFGFGVFFGTFAKGGYLVKADDLALGNIEKETQTQNGKRYTSYTSLIYNEGDELYQFTITYANEIYDYIYEDYNIDIDVIAGDLDFAGGFLSIDNYNDSISANLDDIYQDIDGDYIILKIEFIISGTDFDYTYLFINYSISGIYLDSDSISQNQITDSDNITCLGAYYYNDIFNRGYYIGLDEAYQPAYDEGYADGHEDGYDEGYALGETAGYNDGLDIGYYNGYEVGHYDGYTEGEAYGYTTGLDEGYWYGLDEGLNLSGYKEAYEKGIAKAENTATTWFKGIFNGLQGFLNIEIMGISIGTIILIPVAISFVWFIIRQFRGGGGGD